MGDLVYEPPRDGPTLWEIGIPDRSAAEFFVPDPDPKYINRLYVNHPDRLAHFLLQFFFTKESVVCYRKIRGERYGNHPQNTLYTISLHYHINAAEYTYI